MKKTRDLSILLLALYAAVYLSLIVPLHVASADCSHDDGHGATALHASPDETSGETTGSGTHDHHRCQICLTGGLHQGLPTAVFILTVDLSSIDLVRDGAMSESGVTLSHCRLSRAPPAFA